MTKKCAIIGCDSIFSLHDTLHSIPMFPLPKNNEIQNKWFLNIDSIETKEKLQNGSVICIKHFQNKFIVDKTLSDKAIPTLCLKTANTLIDYEELLSQKPPSKKKRGTSGLMNLQLARKKKLMRRERMQKLAEKRKTAKTERTNNHNKSPRKKSEITNGDNYSDYYLGNRAESEPEKVVISLRLTGLMQQLHDTKATTICKHPSSIRDVKNYPIFNKIKNVQELLINPVFWTKEQVAMFIKQITSQKAITKRFDNENIDGEAVLNLNKSDLMDYLNIDENTSEILSKAFEQLRKETIMRYVNS